MIRRILQEKLGNLLRTRPAVVLIGPRQVGKTTLVLEVAEDLPSIYLDLENQLDLLKVADIHAFQQENQDKLIILDEVQHTPELFKSIRGIIDQQRRSGKKHGLFLFLGSASLDLLQQSGESLAGRVSYLELTGVNALEYDGQDHSALNELWVRGGFPESLLAETDKDSLEWRRDFIRTYLERDIPQLGPRIPAQTLLRFWTMLAHQQGGTFNASAIGANLEMSSVSIARYLDLMCDLLLVRRLQPWFSNVGKRLVKTPKVYVRDSGILHSLLNIPSFNELLSHPVLGGSWEGFVIENLLSILDGKATAYYYRTSAGAEIDLLLEFSGSEKWAIEIKRSSAPSVSKGFYNACEDIQPAQAFVVYAGSDEFPLGKGGARAISLPLLMKKLAEKT
jgi:uncharacterized protein